MWYMGQAQSQTPEPQLSGDMVSTSWNPKIESWYSEMTMENSSTISESLTSCYGLLESSWSARSSGSRIISESRIRHAFSSCKAFISLAIQNELHTCHTEASYWYTVNLISSALGTVLFIAITCLMARLRNSNRVKSRMKRYLPERFFDMENKQKSWFHRAKPKPTPRAAFTASAPTNTSPVNMAPQYTRDTQYKSTGIYPPLPGASSTRPTSHLGSPGSQYPGTGLSPTTRGQSDINGPNYPVTTLRGQSDSAGTNYPVAACRHSCCQSNLHENVPRSVQYNQEDEIDRHLAIAEHNTGGRNIVQRDTNLD